MLTDEQVQGFENQGGMQVTTSIIEGNELASSAIHLELSKMAGSDKE